MTDHARQEFERFVSGVSGELLRTGYLVVWDLGEAEDLVQECLIKVAKRWPRVRSMDHPVAYARRILIGLALDGSKRRSRRRGELAAGRLIEGADDASLSRLDLVGLRSELIQALGELAPRQRAVVVLRYYGDLPEAEVAAALGCSVGTVKSTSSRALARLQAALVSGVDAQGADDERTITRI
jgi:RNA polymerase sigma-70 factor (sigma-E family)